MMDVVFETFATLITAALPPDISSDFGLGFPSGCEDCGRERGGKADD